MLFEYAEGDGEDSGGAEDGEDGGGAEDGGDGVSVC